jgi:hypothetical protein
MECDFCSNPRVVRRYQCMDFDAESKDAGVLYNGTRDTTGPTNLVLHSMDFWAACEMCARYVDEENIDGLLGYVTTVLCARGYRVSADTVLHMRHTYELFFRNRIQD